MTRRPLLPLLFAVLLLAPAPAGASTEQFASFDIIAPEVDDEGLLDYFLSRAPDDWREDWERDSLALRFDQGCMTADTWYQDNAIQLRTPVGRHSWLDLGYLQHTDLETSYQWLQVDVLRGTPIGAFGARFRPAYEKSQQDFAALWQLGDGRSPLQVHAVLTIEDTFNKLWTFRQASVGGGHLEPYRVHPLEPAFDLVWRGPHHRLQLSDTWLTPARQDVVDADPALAGTKTLRGNHAFALAERDVGRWSGQLRFESTSARSSRTSPSQPGDGRIDRQAWTAEAAIRCTVTPRLRAEARYLYSRRAQSWRPPAWDGTFVALDRVAHAGLAWQARPGWGVLSGLLYDRVGVAVGGGPPGFTWGSRKESRAYVGLQARIGRIRVQGVEGIELDHEAYEVEFHHDKAFLHLQTTF